MAGDRSAVALDDSGLGELCQAIGQHLVGKRGQRRAQFAVGAVAAQQFANHQRRPAAVQCRQRDLHRALGSGCGDVRAWVVGEPCRVTNRSVSHEIAS